MGDAASEVALPCGEASFYSRRCAEKETANEDAAVIIPVGQRAAVLAVADGVGGLPQGAEASRVTLETLVELVTRANNPDRLRVAILDAIEKANRRVLALGGGAGTTLAVVQVVDGRARSYHVGDSEIFIVGGRGAIKLQTLAHGPVAYGVHCGLIDPAEALLHENRNVVSNVIGAHDMRIELGPQLKLAQRDLILLCSDGLTDNLHAEELAATICGKSPETAGRSLLEALQIRREQNDGFEFKEDDTTFILYRRAKHLTVGPR
jgi:protein phosphatase